VATPPAPRPVILPPRLVAPRLLVFRPEARIRCAAATTCRVRVRWNGRVLARGRAHAATATTLRVRSRLTEHGRRTLEHRLGGVRARLTVVAVGGGHRHAFAVRRRTLLGVERVVTPPGTFVPGTAWLTSVGRRFAARLRGALHAVKRVRCDGYAAGSALRRSNSYDLSVARARRICGLFGDVRTHVAGHGTTNPRADYRTERGRAPQPPRGDHRASLTRRTIAAAAASGRDPLIGPVRLVELPRQVVSG
jgi:hypothetical protein